VAVRRIPFLESEARSFDTDRESFLGRYGGVAHPAGVRMKKLKRRSGNWLDPCASLHHTLVLKPGERTEIVYTLGCAASKPEAAELAARFAAPGEADRALEDVAVRWRSLLETVHVATPDPSMDLMENIWLKYQAISGRMWGRTAYYQTGGAYGFRDQLQDSQLWLSIDPELAKRATPPPRAAPVRRRDRLSLVAPDFRSRAPQRDLGQPALAPLCDERLHPGDGGLYRARLP
jgi:cellobiose phosphorylase